MVLMLGVSIGTSPVVGSSGSGYDSDEGGSNGWLETELEDWGRSGISVEAGIFFLWSPVCIIRKGDIVMTNSPDMDMGIIGGLCRDLLMIRMDMRMITQIGDTKFLAITDYG